MKRSDLDKLVESARGTGRYGGSSRPPKRRIVVRIDDRDLDRLDALRRDRFPEASRATLIRAFVLLGLSMAEGGAP